MDFLLLGPMEARDGDRVIDAGLRRSERFLLALLLLEPRRVVAAQRLQAMLGDERGPVPRKTLTTYLSRLRARLVPLDGGDQGVRIIRRGDGYLIDVAPEAVDAQRFTAAVAGAGQLADAAERMTAFGTALALWRGPLLADVADDSLRERVGAGLDELRLSAIEHWAQAKLDCGRHDEVVADLVGSARQHPSRERLAGLLMVALYRCGRQVDALTVYRQVRDLLADEYGVEPGPELSRVHDQVLRNDPALSAGPALAVSAHRTIAPVAHPAGATAIGPGADANGRVRMLPRDIAEFVGRADTLAELDALISRGPASGATAPMIISIDGMAGVGKTALAVRLANLTAESYPDGQYYLDLHGHSDRTPVEPPHGLDVLLRQAGVAGDRIPQSLEERAAVWRATTAGRRVTVLLDNASGTTQVVPLLPAGAGCLVLITSRRRLVGLDGARTVSLDVLTSEEAGELLRTVIGDRVARDPQSAAQIAALCGNLALALRLAAARLVHRPAWQAGDIVDLLRQAGPQRHAVAVEGRSVGAAFSLSYQYLSEAAQRLLRLLGVHPGTEFGTQAAAALVDLPPTQADGLLQELVDCHLVQEPVPNRYRLHDLVRDYSASLVEEDPHREPALDRLLDFFTASAVAAAEQCMVTTSVSRFEFNPPPGAALRFSNPTEAWRWFDVEYESLMASIRVAAASGRHRITYQLTRATWHHHYQTGRLVDCLETHNLALAAAEHLGDKAAIAEVYNYRAAVYHQTGRLGEAFDDLCTAAEHARDLPHLLGKVFGNTSLVLHELGRLDEAYAIALRAGEIYREIGDASSASMAGRLTADIDVARHRYDEAVVTWRGLLAVDRAAGEGRRQGMTMASLGGVEVRRGRYRVAVRMLQRGRALRGQTTPRLDALLLTNLATAHRGLGEMDEALQRHAEALRLVDGFGDYASESNTRTAFAATLHATGDTAGAIAQYRQAVDLATRGRARRELAFALDGLAATLTATDPEAASTHLRQALALFQKLGLPEQHDVVRRLAALTDL